MDVSELLAQRDRLREERSVAADVEPEFTLTRREFDYQLRRAFAERERNVEKQINKLLAEHIRDVEEKIAEAMAEHRAEHSGLWADVYGKMFSEERKRHAAEIEKLRSEFDLRISALERGIGGDRGADVIDMPNPLRSRRV
jgi:hypothetical protein